MSKMFYKIAIDVSPLSDGNSVRGVGHYTGNLVSALNKITSQKREFQNYKVDLIDRPTAKLKGYDLVHYPYFDPFKLTLPPKTNQKRIVTVHDLIPREYRPHFPVGLKGEIKWLIQKHRLRQSDLIITPSHYSKNIISQILNFPSDLIYVTYEAANPNFKPRPAKGLLAVKKKYHLPDKFVLFLGDINWNKNIPTLVKACAKLRYPLVIAGGAAVSKVIDHPWTRDILWLQQEAAGNPHIIRTGFLPEEEVPLLFNLATIYCQPSFAEGFGLPLVQAMQSGTPVVYSKASCLNEIMDYNGQMFDPYSQDSLEKALTLLWNDSKLRSRCSKAGLIRSQYFNWEYTAVETLNAYKAALLDEK